MNWKHGIRQGILPAIVTVMTFTIGFAQPGGPARMRDMDPEERLEMHLGFLDEHLDLTDDQVKAVQTILEDAQAEGASWRENHKDASREDRRAFRSEHRKATDAAVLDILNDDQKVAFDGLKELRGHHGRGMSDRRGGKGMGATLEHGRGMRRAFGATMRELKLTSEQRGAIREILTEEQNATLDRMLERGEHGQFRGHGRHGDGPGMRLNQLDLSEAQKEQVKSLQESHRKAAKAWHDANPNATKEERQAFRKAHREGMKAMLNSVLTKEQMEKLEPKPVK